MHQELSAVDIYFLLQELQELVGARLDTLHQLGRKDFLLTLYQAGKGKYFLRITSQTLFLTKQGSRKSYKALCPLFKVQKTPQKRDFRAN